MFNIEGRNVLQYASNEISNNTSAYLSGRARHIVSGSNFTISDVFRRDIHIMGQAISPNEKKEYYVSFGLFFGLNFYVNQSQCHYVSLIDEDIANGPIPNILEALVTLCDRGISLIQCFQFHSGIASIYGRDLAKAVFDSHQTHILLTKGL